MSVFLLVNPAAGSGRAAGLVPAARAALEHERNSIGPVTIIETKSPGDEARCAREALARGAHTIVSLGGDGTISHVARELVRAKSHVPLAIFGAGTGNDFARSLGTPVHDFRAVAALIAGGRVTTVDAGRVDGEVFVNIAGFGFDTEVLARTTRPSLLRGNALYGVTAVGQLFRYPGFNARIVIDGDEYHATKVATAHWLTLVFANGAWFGAGFHIAPHAALQDGQLSSVFIRNTSPLRRASIFARAMRGTHLAQPEVIARSATTYTLRFDTPPLYQADGELRQAASATVTVESVPAALRVIA